MADLPKWQWSCFLNNGFQNEFQEGYIETTPDAGIPYRRLRFSDIQDIVTGSVLLTNAEYIDFMSWYKNDIKQGTIPFKMYDCRVERERTARLTMNKPVFSRYSTRWSIPVTIAYDSEVFYLERALSANGNRPLIANGKKLTANVKRYL